MANNFRHTFTVDIETSIVQTVTLLEKKIRSEHNSGFTVQSVHSSNQELDGLWVKILTSPIDPLNKHARIVYDPKTQPNKIDVIFLDVYGHLDKHDTFVNKID